MVGIGRIEEGRAGRWLREVLGVVELYVRIWEGCVACYRGGEGGGATADLGGEWAALCKVEVRRF
jgi:hypothetical protein